ncbi:hypothetical protein [Legionella sp.]|uniref:hypothetical protein n=1 Tax=Legionella sp. TaxID=459 RepID=UPI0039E58B84
MKEQNLKQVKHLIEGAQLDINCPDPQSLMSPLVAAMNIGNFEIINYLLDKNVAINGFQPREANLLFNRCI